MTICVCVFTFDAYASIYYTVDIIRPPVKTITENVVSLCIETDKYSIQYCRTVSCVCGRAKDKKKFSVGGK